MLAFLLGLAALVAVALATRQGAARTGFAAPKTGPRIGS